MVPAVFGAWLLLTGYTWLRLVQAQADGRAGRRGDLLVGPVLGALGLALVAMGLSQLR